ncbi:TPA: GNAT family N-acetyltransferase [Stenotrophomonas maltophilia]|uniref:GNAT family N-acetyltransferase n=1 Tax=Stenotrophomonas TaxID=40323 RepID=UPI0013DA606C|nr:MULTISPECIES: GNAT family N-acetyltransferase [Stenotrophomonas]MRI44501.1 N-acetyltransferase [Stenotrophomonas sp. MH181796]HDS1128865.1 GNAT family N-acetyltransferase [Stenotrophomonas maltophilia]HDS1157407.1 GNAT family N-acetyltransferase [Stenotrophomonas maltophilia]HDS1165579.1 GNAT family N-acetyltransferase [Stenotrophomonas maltophilia]HDS1169834.1 GNAT family N-acetyltransferase [Stenotrophomonas maltophilia]
MHPIESERLRLRAIEPDRDAAPMLALLNDPGFVRFIGDRGVRTQQEARDYAAMRVLPAYALHGYGMYAIERLADGAWLGNAGLVRRDGLPGPDIGYAVLSEFAGQGYAGEAARAVFAYARAELGLHDLYGITDLDNMVSGKILLGLGMEERGVIQLPGVDSPSRLYATPGAVAVPIGGA